MIKLYFSTVKILAQRPTCISAVATDRQTDRDRQRQRDRETETDRDRERQRETERMCVKEREIYTDTDDLFI